MEGDTTVALVPSSREIIVAASIRQSYCPPDDANHIGGDVFIVNDGQNDAECSSSTNSSRSYNLQSTWEAVSVIISLLYGKILMVLGLALPITHNFTSAIPAEFCDIFYIYLYGGSLIFMVTSFFISFRKKRLRKLSGKKCSATFGSSDTGVQTLHSHGSFYLRMGACGFGIGSMVYSGLEFAGKFVQTDEECFIPILSIIKPALRMVFTLLQIQFLFLRDCDSYKSKYSGILRLSLAHMLATNIAEWLAVIIDETKHEMHNLQPLTEHLKHGVNNFTNKSTCNADTDKILVEDVEMYLFPCKIEYSLICAVLLVELIKDIKLTTKNQEEMINTENKGNSNGQLSIDCTHTDRGLAAGLVASVYTIISLIVFFSLRSTQPESAQLCIILCECILNVTSLLAMASSAYKMRKLPYGIHRLNKYGSLQLGLDIKLLLKAQFGSYLYLVFSAIACFFSSNASVWPDLITSLQTTVQTIFIIENWWKRCENPRDMEKKPGRQEITFLRPVNMSLWIISIFEKNRATLNTTQLNFYGMMPWAIISHVSMPLYIFYRFHSTICFYEIWKNSYKDVAVDSCEDVQI